MIRIEKPNRNGRTAWRVQGRVTGTEGEYFTQELAAFVEEQGGTDLDLDLRRAQFMSDKAIEVPKRRTVPSASSAVTGSCGSFWRQKA